MIGIDTVRISRIAAAIEKPSFVNGVFTQAEQDYCNSRPKPEHSYAGVFCAKEAAVKAIKLGFTHGIRPTDIEVAHDGFGAPVLLFHGAAADAFSGMSADVSVSHDGEYAIAAVQLCKERS